MITIMHSDPIMDSPVYSTRLDYTLLPDPPLPHEKKKMKLIKQKIKKRRLWLYSIHL